MLDFDFWVVLFVLGGKQTFDPLLSLNQEGHLRRIQLKDYGIGALWDAHDGDIILKNLQRRGYAESFDQKLLRAYNDKTVNFKEELKAEPLHIVFKEDLVVNAGLQRIAQLIVGESTTSFTHMASGTGTAGETADDQALAAENARVSLSTSGYRVSQGVYVKMGGFFPKSTATANVRESGSFDGPSGGVMLYRTLYDDVIGHTQNVTVYTITQVIAATSL